MKALIELIVFYTHIVNYFMYVIIKYALRIASKCVYNKEGVEFIPIHKIEAIFIWV